MATLSTNRRTKHVLRSDIDFLLRLISELDVFNTFPLTERGKIILKLLWDDNKSFSEIAKQISLSQARVIQIYHLEIRRLSYFIDSTFKEAVELKTENNSLRDKNKFLSEENKKLRKKAGGFSQ